MGAYDDLLPGGKPAAEAGPYDDLLPGKSSVAPASLVEAATAAAVPRGTTMRDDVSPDEIGPAIAINPKRLLPNRRPGEPQQIMRSGAAEGLPAAIETGIRLGTKSAGSIAGAAGGGLGAAAAAAVDLLHGTPAQEVLGRFSEAATNAIGNTAEAVTPPVAFAATPRLEELVGKVIDMARTSAGLGAEAVEQARGDLARHIMPSWLEDYVKAHPEAARTLGEGGFDALMYASPLKKPLLDAHAAGIAETAARAAEESRRFRAARDVTPSASTELPALQKPAEPIASGSKPPYVPPDVEPPQAANDDVHRMVATGGAADAYDGFKQTTGKYPWEMPYEQFFKLTVSRVKQAMPGKPQQWYGNVLRNEWSKAQEFGKSIAQGGAPDEIPANEGQLTPAQRIIETDFRNKVQADPQSYVDEYVKRFGNVVNTDNARELSEAYATSNDTRSALSAAVHEPSSFIAKEVYRQLLEQPVPEGKQPDVLFTSGGTGAGKSTAINKHPVLSAIADHADIVFDTNMNGYEASVKKIDQALNSGRNATIMRVYRDPVSSMTDGSLHRAMDEKNGRTVQIVDHADTHVGSTEAIQKLRQHYKGNDRVKFIYIDNNGNKYGDSTTRVVDAKDYDAFDRAAIQRMGDRTALRKELLDAVNREEQAGRISPLVANATRASETVARPVSQVGDGQRGGESRPSGGVNGTAGRGNYRGVVEQNRAAALGVQGRGSVSRSAGRFQTPGAAAAGTSALAGLPSKVEVPGHGVVEFGPFDVAVKAAEDYAKSAGIDYQPPTQYAKLDPARATRIAGAFDTMPNVPDNPIVKKAYAALTKETIAQFQAVKATGLKIEFIKPGMDDPYSMSPRLAIMDVRDNNHLWVFPTDAGFGMGKVDPRNPMLKPSGETIDGKPALVNDVFRIVHDYFGHIKEGVGFRAEGEENAYRSHYPMFSPEARRALATETRGKNSWLNYGPHGEKNRTAKTADTVFADQKIGLLPQWAVDDGAADAAGERMAATGGEPQTKWGKVAAGDFYDVQTPEGKVLGRVTKAGDTVTLQRVNRDGTSIKGQSEIVAKVDALGRRYEPDLYDKGELALYGTAKIPATGGAPDGITDERNPKIAPKANEKFIVYRVGKGNGLENRNGGNADSIAYHLMRSESFDSPINIKGDTITAYEVSVPGVFGKYGTFNKGRGEGTMVGRELTGFGKAGNSVSYSFPAGSKYSARELGSVKVDDVRKTIGSFDDSGVKAGGEAIRKAFEQQATGGGLTVRDIKHTLTERSPDQVRESAVRIKTVPPEALGFKSLLDINNIQPLHKQERDFVASIVSQLIGDGMHPDIIKSVNGFVKYDKNYSNFGALYWPQLGVLGIRQDRLMQAQRGPGERHTLVQTFAHEITHHVDNDPDGPYKTQTLSSALVGGNYISAKSPRLKMEQVGLRGQPMLVNAHGDLSQEIFRAGQLDPAIANHFNYPLAYMIDGRFTPEQGAVELLAQVGALYFSDRATVKAKLPKWFQLMEKVYGDQSTKGTATEGNATEADTIGASRARLREALQDNDAVIENEESLGQRRSGEPSDQADGGGGIRGPPGRGVGERTGEHQVAASGGTPNGADDRSLNAGSTNGQWDVNEPGVIDNIVREFANNKIDLHRVQNEIERVAGTLPDDNNPRLAEEVFKGRVRTKVVRFHKNAVEPLLKAIASSKSGITPQDVGNYLWARHAPERNAQMSKINPGGPDNLSGLSNAQASDMVKDFARDRKLGDLKAVAAMVDHIVHSTQVVLVREKLESQSTIDAWNNVYSNYVPLFRDVDEPATGMGFKVKGPESKRAMGSQKEAIAVLAAVIAQHEKVLIRAEKAKVGRELIKMAEDHPNPDFWRVDTPPTKRIINKSTGLVETIIDPLYKNRDDVFVVKDMPGGPGTKVVERVLAFNPKSERAVRLSKAMQNLDVVQLGGVTKVVGSVTRVMANLATSWNPQFWATNFARDVQTAAVNLQATPLKGHAPQVMANIPHAMAGILSAEFKNGNGRWAQLYREFEDEGGKMGFMDSFNDLIERHKAINKEIKRSQRSMVNPLKWAEIAMDTIEKVNSAVENGTRLSIYAQARKIGQSPRMSASIAKNATVNFDRKGNRSAATGSWYMFFNASVQGTAILMKSIAKSRKVQAFVAVMTAFAAAEELYNRMIGDSQRDESGNNPYELIPEYVRQTNMIFMLPKGEEGGTPVKDVNDNIIGHYASLPLPYGFSIFNNAGRMMMQAALGSSKLVDEKATASDYALNFANTMANNFAPLGGSSTPLQYFAPTVVKPVVQQLENKTWFGAPIHPEPQPFGKPKPASSEYFRTTSDTAKELAKWLSDTTGGDEIAGGALDIHPGNIEHVFNTVAGGTGKFGLGMFDFAKHIAGRVTGSEAADDMPWRNVPFVGKFYGEVDEQNVAAKYYRLSQEAQKVFKQYTEYKKTGDRDKADALEAAHPELIDMGKEIAKKTTRADMKRVREDFKGVDELPKSERPKERRELKREEVGIMGEALKAYNEGVAERRRDNAR